MTRLQRREQGQIARPTQFDNEQAMQEEMDTRPYVTVHVGDSE